MKTVSNKSAAASVKDAAKIIAAENDTFTFRLERDLDTDYTLPLLQDLPVKAMRQLAKADGDDIDVDAVLDLFDSLCPGLTDVATQREMALIMEAWSDASNVSLGE